MAEIEARREARRRKILENSEKRLHKISGVEQKSTKTELDGIRESVPNADEKTNTIFDDITENEVLRNDRITEPSPGFSSEHRRECRNIRLDDTEHAYNYQDTNVNSKRSNRSLHIFVLPTILSFTLVIFDLFEIDLKSVYLNKIFIPLLIYEVIEYFGDSAVDVSPNFLTSLLLLTNFKNRFLSSYIHYLHYFLRLMQDVMVYFFVFSLSHSLFSFILL